MRVAGETVCGRALQGSSQPHICSAVFVVPDVKGIFSIILILFSLSGPGDSQYQLVRKDPFAQLSSTLQNKQAAACDGQVLNLDCPKGTKIGIQLFEYGRSAATSLLCPATPQLPVQYSDDLACSITQAIVMGEEMCQGKQSCSIETGFNILSPGSVDPCPGLRKHAKVSYTCKPASFRSRSVCGQDDLTLSCTKPDDRIAVLSSSFLSISSGHIYCPLVKFGGFQQDSLSTFYSSEVMDTCEDASASPAVLHHCHGQSECSLSANPIELGILECKDLHVYLKTTYACVDKAVFKPQFLESRTTVLTSTTEVITSTALLDNKNLGANTNGAADSGKYLPEEIKQREYIEGGGLGLPGAAEHAKNPDIIPHPLEEETFVNYDQELKMLREKIVIALIVGISIVLVGVIFTIFIRLYRNYRTNHEITSIVSTPHTDLDSLEYDMAQYLEHAPGHSGHSGHSPHPGHQTPHHHCHKDLQQSSYHLQHDLHQHDNSQGGQQQQPSTTSRQQQQHDIQQQQQQQEHYVVEVQPSNPLEHLYGTLVRKSQTPVYGSVMKPIPDQLDIQQDNSNTATNTRKPKGILKNSKQTADGSIGSCNSFTTSTAGGGNSKTPLSPMSDIVVTYSHKENIETLSTSRHMAKPGSVLVSPGAAGGTAAALATQTLGRSKMLSSKPYEKVTSPQLSTFTVTGGTSTTSRHRNSDGHIRHSSVDGYDRRFDCGSSVVQPRIIIDHHTDSDSIFRSFNLSGTSQEKCDPAAALLLGSPGSAADSTAIVLGNKTGLTPAARHFSDTAASGETAEISNLPHSDSSSSDKLFVL